MRRLTVAVALSLATIGPQILQGADFLPDAAGHIGTLLINNNDEFTTNTAVTLSLNAVDDGTGVVQMQFSNDDENWSAPEPYQTNRQWALLNDGIYPPYLNTVLRTVYVRFQDGAGNWTPAVSDSIVFAKSAADVPVIQEVWIAQQAPTNYDSTQPPGSAQNPYLVPAAPNEPAFDLLMHSLSTNYNNYWPQGSSTNPPPRSDTNTVLSLHIGPGLYETHGDNPNHGSAYCWVPRNGWRIFGAGKNATTLKAVDLAQSFTYRVNVIGGYGDLKNTEIADLTLDANIQEAGTNMNGQFSQCLIYTGDNLQIRRVRTMNAGSHLAGGEASAIAMLNFGAQYDNWNLVLEDCELLHIQYGNAYQPNMLGICGEYGNDGKMRYYHNVFVRNCYIDGAAYNGDNPINPYQFSAIERGNHGMGIGGTIDAIIENNFVLNVSRGYYADESSPHNLTLRNNHYRNVYLGANLSLIYAPGKPFQLEDYFVFANNLVELDPHWYSTGEIFISTLGVRYSMLMFGNLAGPTNYSLRTLVFTNNVFQFNDQQPPGPQVVGYAGLLQDFSNAVVSDNVFYNMTNSLTWANNSACLDQQVDLLYPTRPTPLIVHSNHFGDGTLAEAFPYVLDKTLAQPVVTAGQLVSLAPPQLDDLSATIADGWPQTNTLNPSGLFQWQTGPQDAGRYVISFYDTTNRLRDPRRVLLTVLGQVPPTDPHYFANGLMAYWKLNEASGGAFTDSSGNNLGLVATQAVAAGVLSQGVAGIISGQRAAHFNARPPSSIGMFQRANGNDQLFSGYPVMYQPFLLQGTTLFHPLTIGLWVKPDVAPASSQTIFNLNCQASMVFCSVLSKPGVSNRVGFYFSSSVHDIILATPISYAVGAWHQLMIVYDGVSASLYVDNALAARQPCGQLTGFSRDSILYFGGGFGTPGFIGSMAHLAIWDRPWSATEVSRLYSDQLAGITPVLTPVAPSALTARSVGGITVTVSWQDNSTDESAFVVERSGNGTTFAAVATLPADSATYTESIPQPLSGYYYRVKAVNAFGSSAYSNVGFVLIPRPPVPAGLRVSWSPSGG
ncbi:MAG TPA: LamG-like jellyroll fold domain-containing protein [Verrucomicrobiae bacterium]|nr:LamG-like jellyroll fold domain-containing protein [Verrucomicrobiae bacterium]